MSKCIDNKDNDTIWYDMYSLFTGWSNWMLVFCFVFLVFLSNLYKLCVCLFLSCALIFFRSLLFGHFDDRYLSAQIWRILFKKFSTFHCNSFLFFIWKMSCVWILYLFCGQTDKWIKRKGLWNACDTVDWQTVRSCWKKPPQ